MPTSEEDTTDTQSADVVSDEELKAKADEVQALREEVANVEAQRVANEAALSNQITMTELQTEEARLRARLAQAKGQVEGGAVENANTPLASAKEQMEAAVLSQQSSEAAARGEVFEAPSSEPPPPVEPETGSQPTADTPPATGASTDAPVNPSDDEGSRF